VYLGAVGYHQGDWLQLTPAVAQTAAAAGFCVLNTPVAEPHRGTDADVARYRSVMADHGLLVGQVNGRYGGGLVSADAAQRADTIEFVRDLCGLAARLGAPNVYFRPGSLNPRGAWLPSPENRSPAVFDRLVDSARQICHVAQEEGVRLAVEAGVVCPLYSPRRIRDFFDAVGSPALGFNQDPVNLIGSLETAYDTQSLIEECFALLGSFTIGAHLKDFTLIEALLPHFQEAEIDSGMLDHVLLLRHMRSTAPQAHVLIEHIPDALFPAARAAILRYGEEAGIAWSTVA
jgi:hypothetical protein